MNIKVEWREGRSPLVGQTNSLVVFGEVLLLGEAGCQPGTPTQKKTDATVDDTRPVLGLQRRLQAVIDQGDCDEGQNQADGKHCLPPFRSCTCRPKQWLSILITIRTQSLCLKRSLFSATISKCKIGCMKDNKTR